jgi:hypothetical protein
LLFLTAVVLAARTLFQNLKQSAQDTLKLSKLQNDTIKHLSNLLASKDPLAFQQVQSVTVEPETRYTGPYLSGDEIELLEQQEAEMLKAWKSLADDVE